VEVAVRSAIRANPRRDARKSWWECARPEAAGVLLRHLLLDRVVELEVHGGRALRLHPLEPLFGNAAEAVLVDPLVRQAPPRPGRTSGRRRACLTPHPAPGRAAACGVLQSTSASRRSARWPGST